MQTIQHQTTEPTGDNLEAFLTGTPPCPESDCVAGRVTLPSGELDLCATCGGTGLLLDDEEEEIFDDGF